MLERYVNLRGRVQDHLVSCVSRLRLWVRRCTLVTGQSGQTTAEYALVILAAAAVAIVLITWAESSGKLPAFFDKVIDDLTNSF
jgi:Flp pilus assembly pilin Flp